MKKLNAKSKNQRKNGGIWWFLGISTLCAGLLLCCQFLFKNEIIGDERFYENTFINGIDVGGMSVAQAENVVLTDMLDKKKDVEISLSCKDKNWTLRGNDFEVTNKLEKTISNFSRYGRDGNFFQNLRTSKKVKEEGKNFVVSYANILANMHDKLEEVISAVEQQPKPASLVFNPNSDDVFEVDLGMNSIVVDRDKLYSEIDSALASSQQVHVDIPIIETVQEIDVEAIKNSVGKRSEFSTNYAKSSKERKSNIKRALENFNGMIVEKGQVVSFNETTGLRTKENGYQNAHIIVGGVYVDGVGGGVCQASTTLYNALLLADVDILTVNHHTIPASYVPLSFDAMVSGGYSDLVFQNNLDGPIYIKTKADDQKISVEIYGQKLPAGWEIKRRAELVKILPHNGDKIVPDKSGECANKVLYKGEYLRIKYPREGYESRAFLQYYIDGKLDHEKEIRHDFYPAQDGIVMEGVEDMVDGMIMPASDVKIIKPQKVTKSTEESVRQKLSKLNPSEYNP